MIKNLKIVNFQSHEDSSLEFSDGVNIFTGNSDCGKSSIMRAIIWALTNTPHGDSFVRNDIRNEKGKIKGICSVTIDGIKRVKSDTDNCYLYDGEKFEALRGEVPAQISKAFGIGGVSIQKQLDSPFMLGNTNGENAKYINELVNLESIDLALSWAGTRNRSLNSELKFTNNELENIRLCNEDELKFVDSELNRLETIDDKINELQTKLSVDTRELEYQSKIAMIDTSELEQLIYTYEKTENEISRLENLGSTLFNMLSSFANCPQNIELPDMSDLEAIESAVDILNNKIVWLLKSLTEYKSLNENLDKLKNESNNLHREIKGQCCPCCGQVYNGD